VKVPTTFEELHQTLLFYSGIMSILFGLRSALVAGAKSIAAAISYEKIIFKGRIASDRKLPAKILYALEIRIQCWLGECLKFEDRSMVNDRLVCFDKVFEMVMNSTINVTLPPNFGWPQSPLLLPPLVPCTPRATAKRRGGRRGSQETSTGNASPRTPPPSPSSC
jgi:hypothetical protein